MARSTFKVLFYVNGSKEKNGIVPIMGRVTINGTVAQFSCKRTIPKELWDAKGNKAKGKSMEARETNLALDNIKAQIIKHYQRISDREAYVTAEMVRNAYQGLGGEYETLLGAFDKENEVFKKRVGKDRVMATTVHGWWQETMWQHSSDHITSGTTSPCLNLRPTSSRSLPCSFPLTEDCRTAGRFDMGKLHVAERCGDAGTFQRTYTEKSVCPVPYKPEHERA